MPLRPDPRIVDAHVHVWDVRAFPLPWFRDDLGLPRAAAAGDLRAAAAAAGVEAAIAVQAADSLAEARWLAALAGGDPLIRRAVLQYAPAPAAPSGRTSAALSPAVAGFRAAVPQCAADLADVAGLDALAAFLGGTGGVLEMLVRPEQLPAVAALSRRHPAARIVICHLGLGAGRADAAWFSALAVAASAPGVSAKVSGLDLPARAGAGSREVVTAAFEAFGADRLMFGSDWPMSVRRCGYDDVIAATIDAMPALDPAASAAFWAGTATRLYAL
ncbi:amidohydrolase family protein [Microbacterium hydrocarbonoxydans]|uniref:amidohydrolase family protein n=1 Tax=Microbacterium hydrocarbonoxydans TaxID=273678 RepID=UPI0013DD76A4|nr:amidohydrolase family protein [Microbacterium hydrocarbonoxydans]